MTRGSLRRGNVHANSPDGPATPPDPISSGEPVAATAGVLARAEAALIHSHDLVLFYSKEGTIEWASPACRHMFGIRPEDLVGRNGLDVVHREDRAHVVESMASIPRLGDYARIEFRVDAPGGGVRWLEEIATNLLDDPEIGCVVGNLRDVTERVELLQRIEHDRRRLAEAQASAKLGSFELDLETSEIHRSDELCRMLGLEPGTQAAGGMEFIHPDDRDRIRQVIADAFAGRDQAPCTYRIVRVDGAVRWVLSQAKRLGAPNGNVVAGTMLDITERHEADLALAHQATHDWLTQLPNAASLHETLQSLTSGPQSNRSVAVAVVDVDRFRSINELCGHALGDQVLRAIGVRLRSELLPADVVARIDGDEFVVVRTDVTAADAQALGASVMALMADPITFDDHNFDLTASVGVAVSTAEDSPQSILQDADDAMHESKRDGRNRVTVFDDAARARTRRRRSIATSLPLALERDELHLEYQPILDVSTLATVGFEALLRWEHPDLGPIAPDEFIAIAETSGLILPIGAWVLDRATQQLAAWRADPHVSPELWVAINVSAEQLGRADVVAQVAAAIARANVPAPLVHLEITESVLMGRIDNALSTTAQLRATGVRVSIDDFGTGYSSLSYLSRLPVDTIKIDRSFVSGSGRGAHAASILRAMIALARMLGLTVVAEGVESPDQLDLLRSLGCTQAQGFLWSRGLRPEAALAWMLDHPAVSTSPVQAPPAGDRTDVGRAIVRVAGATGGRRRTSTDLENVLRFDSLEIGLTARKVWLAGRDLNLTPKEFELLSFMAEHPGEVFHRGQLLHEVWDSSPAWQSAATVTEHIHRLRNRIEVDPSRPRLIRTVRGHGYCFGPTSISDSTSAA